MLKDVIGHKNPPAAPQGRLGSEGAISFFPAASGGAVVMLDCGVWPLRFSTVRRKRYDSVPVLMIYARSVMRSLR